MDKEKFKIDKKDSRIIAELFKDGRMPVTRIAKNIGLSQEVVNYRINRLKAVGFLEKIMPIIDPNKLGYAVYFVFINLQKITIDREKDIIQYLANNPYVCFVLSCTGNWDVLVGIFIKDLNHYKNSLGSMLGYIGDNLSSYQSSAAIKIHSIPHSYIFGEILPEDVKKEKKVKIENADIKILKLLEKDGRMPLSAIADNLGISADQIMYRIKKMLDGHIIEKFRPNLKPSLLGYSWYINKLELHNITEEKRKSLIYYLRNNINIFYIAEFSDPNLTYFELMAKTAKEFREIIMKIRFQFPDIIKNHESLIVFEEHKYVNLPEGITAVYNKVENQNTTLK